MSPLQISRQLALVYGFFAIAAGSRALYQIATRWHEAPVAFCLSAIAALIYLIATISLHQPTRRAWWVTIAICSLELAGVLIIGTWTLLPGSQAALFARSTVWSSYGAGYLYLPLILPTIGLIWLLQPATRQAYLR
ncbi:MAG: hypothetical protein Fur005_20330 [Roseiflexaceae bacterium]